VSEVPAGLAIIPGELVGIRGLGPVHSWLG